VQHSSKRAAYGSNRQKQIEPSFNPLPKPSALQNRRLWYVGRSRLFRWVLQHPDKNTIEERVIFTRYRVYIIRLYFFMGMTPNERMALLMDLEKLKSPFLEERTGIKADR